MAGDHDEIAFGHVALRDGRVGKHHLPDIKIKDIDMLRPSADRMPCDSTAAGAHQIVATDPDSRPNLSRFPGGVQSPNFDTIVSRFGLAPKTALYPRSQC